jgi:hypothetical protein
VSRAIRALQRDIMLHTADWLLLGAYLLQNAAFEMYAKGKRAK